MTKYIGQLKDEENLVYPVTKVEALVEAEQVVLSEPVSPDLRVLIDVNGDGFYPVGTLTGIDTTNSDEFIDNIGLSKAVVYDTTAASQTTTSLALLVYPIGSIYMSVNSTSPQTLFGGTWVQLTDRFLLGAGGTYSAGSTGGEASHTLTVDELPNHRHSDNLYNNSSYGGGSNCASTVSNTDGANWTHYTEYTGGGAAHNNMPPYLVVYMWERTA